jgi:hypothetical protein
VVVECQGGPTPPIGADQGVAVPGGGVVALLATLATSRSRSPSFLVKSLKIIFLEFFAKLYFRGIFRI